MSELIKRLKKRYESNYSMSTMARGTWTELERYVVPYRGMMFTKDANEGSVSWDKYDHYDDTAVIAAQTLSASMHGAILPNLKWFDFKFTDDEIQDTNEAADWLADCSKRVYSAILNSNFDLMADEMFIDIVGLGHGFMTAEADGLEEDELSFNMIPLKEAVFEEDHNGVPFYFFRKLEWTPTKIVSKFGIDNVPEIVRDKYNNPHQATETIPVIFAIFPRHEFLNADISRPLAPKVRPFGHLYFLETEGTQVGEEGGYYEMPVFSVRYRKVSGSQWGHGPGHVSLGDIKQLNQHRLMRTRAIEKAVDPANVVTERGLLSNLDLGPRGLTVVRDDKSLWPYESGSNFQISTEEIAMLQQSIKMAFRVDQLELKESPAMTATEVEVRYELMQRLLGPTLGRLKVDWLNRVVENVFNIERRAGRLLPIPGVIAGIDLDTEIEYVGAMAQAQKTQISNDMVQWATQIAELSPAYPDLQFLVNDDALGREIARLKAIPEKVINGKDEAATKKQDMEQVTQQQQLLAQAQAEGDAMKAMGEGQQAMKGA